VKIYTKAGDDGLTGLLCSRRVPKDDTRVEAYGMIDELNAALGVARAQTLDVSADGLLGRLQNELFTVGSALADPNPQGPYHESVGDEHIARLEAAIDGLESELTPLTRFILPGGTPGAASIHLARTICRRAERQVVRLSRTRGEQVPARLIVYLNRLGDLLFVLARVVNHRAGVADVPWCGP
jgi:cob(I)alamin adenosyltransferase